MLPSPQHPPRAAPEDRPAAPRRAAPLAAAAVLAVALGGCTVAPPEPPHVGASPADAEQAVPPVRDTSVLGVYRTYRPAEPGSWRDRNDRVTPAPRP